MRWSRQWFGLITGTILFGLYVISQRVIDQPSLEPWLPTEPDRQLARLVSTIGFMIVMISLLSVVLFRRRTILVIPSLCVLLLFGLLHAQIDAYAPGIHYECDETPVTYSWVEFTGAHLLRAVDVLDSLEEYRVDLQDVHHHGPIAGIVLVAFHIFTAIFVLSLLVRWLMGRVRQYFPQADSLSTQRERAERLARWLHRIQVVGIAVCIVLVIVTGMFQHWSELNWFLWPLDNILRTVDVGDAMQIFHWRLHDVPMDYGTIALSIVFRFVVGLYIVQLMNRFRIRFLRGLALKTADDLVDDLRSHDEELQSWALNLLEKATDIPGRAALPLLEILSDGEPGERPLARKLLDRTLAPPKTDLNDLRAFLKARTPIVRELAARSIAMIDQPSTVASEEVLSALGERLPIPPRLTLPHYPTDEESSRDPAYSTVPTPEVIPTIDEAWRSTGYGEAVARLMPHVDAEVRTNLFEHRNEAVLRSLLVSWNAYTTNEALAAHLQLLVDPSHGVRATAEAVLLAVPSLAPTAEHVDRLLIAAITPEPIARYVTVRLIRTMLRDATLIIDEWYRAANGEPASDLAIQPMMASLGEIPPHLQRALENWLKQTIPDVNIEAIEAAQFPAIVQVHDLMVRLLPCIPRWLTDPIPAIRAEAIVIANAYRNHCPLWNDAFMMLVADPAPALRHAALCALREHGNPPTTMIGRWIPYLADREAAVREAMRDLLAEMPTVEESQYAELQPLLDDADERIQLGAIRELTKSKLPYRDEVRLILLQWAARRIPQNDVERNHHGMMLVRSALRTVWKQHPAIQQQDARSTDPDIRAIVEQLSEHE